MRAQWTDTDENLDEHLVWGDETGGGNADTSGRTEPGSWSSEEVRDKEILLKYLICRCMFPRKLRWFHIGLSGIIFN